MYSLLHILWSVHCLPESQTPPSPSYNLLLGILFTPLYFTISVLFTGAWSFTFSYCHVISFCHSYYVMRICQSVSLKAPFNCYCYIQTALPAVCCSQIALHPFCFTYILLHIRQLLSHNTLLLTLCVLFMYIIKCILCLNPCFMCFCTFQSY